MFSSEIVDSALDWQDELNKFWFMIDERTEISLELIKRGRIQMGLPFDAPFQNELFCSTNSRYEVVGNISLKFNSFLIN